MFLNCDRSISKYSAKFSHNIPEILNHDGVYEITLVLGKMNPVSSIDIVPHFILYDHSTKIALELPTYSILPNLSIPYPQELVKILSSSETGLIEELLSWFIELGERPEFHPDELCHSELISFNAVPIESQKASALSKLLRELKSIDQQKLEIETEIESFISGNKSDKAIYASNYFTQSNCRNIRFT